MKIVHRVLFSSALLLAIDFIYLSANKGAWETQIVQIQRVVMQLKIVPAIDCCSELLYFTHSSTGMGSIYVRCYHIRSV